MEKCDKIDRVVSSVLEQFAVTIIKRVSEKTKIDPDVVAASVPGLVHTHWFIPDDDHDGGFVQGCAYCDRCKSIRGKKEAGVPAE